VDNISSKSFNPFKELNLEALSYHLKRSVVPYIEDSIGFSLKQKTKFSVFEGILYKYTIPASLHQKPIIKYNRVRFCVVFKISGLAILMAQLIDCQAFTCDKRRKILEFKFDNILKGQTNFIVDVYNLDNELDKTDIKNKWLSSAKKNELSNEWIFFGKDADDIAFETNYSKSWQMLLPSDSRNFQLLHDPIHVFPENSDIQITNKNINTSREEFKPLPTDKRKKDEDLKCLSGTRWKDITITLVADDMIDIATPRWTKRRICHQLGLSDGRNLYKSSILWKRLVQLCENNGCINEKLCNDKTAQHLPDQLKKLAKKLKSLLEINGNFRRYDSRKKNYVAYAGFKDKRIKNDDGQDPISTYDENLLDSIRKVKIDYSDEGNF
jgi:hypothetical protein